DDALEAYLANAKLVARTPRTVTDPARLREEILKVRRQGWALLDEELEEGLISLAAPLVSRNGRVMAAINVGLHRSRMNAPQAQQQILPKLLATARKINERLAVSGAY
ncbi:MAG TPA: IclR family transcriptional regulator C-terminal domain-containing protein, partial [Burkholderiaceae bacterium]|nr:IclR family transcriptional regulator C-terminal domain-containing protein [Burkholderiaceae bacterium]